jgi:hypothetical protein
LGFCVLGVFKSAGGFNPPVGVWINPWWLLNPHFQ